MREFRTFFPWMCVTPPDVGSLDDVASRESDEADAQLLLEHSRRMDEEERRRAEKLRVSRTQNCRNVPRLSRIL